MQAKPLSIAEIRKNAATFVAEWSGETYEKGESQSFWTDLLAVYGVNRRKVARFEAKAQRLDGGTGFIDLFWPGMLIAEQKSAGKDLAKAEEQAMDYLDTIPDAEQPRYVITSNFEEFRLRDLDTPPGEDPVVTFPLEDLPVEAERFGFIAGYQKRSFGSTEQAEASIKAAQLMADLYVELEKTGYDEHEASIFLVRTLFALFADDAGIWERDLFLEFLETRTNEDGSDLGAQMAVLFQTLDRPTGKRLTSIDPLLARFPYVNGTVFGETISIPYFDRAMRDKLIECCHFNWGEISPAIFGSLFQAVKSKEARRELGEHYTTETNILKTVGPLFLDELRQRFVDNQHDLAKLRKLHRDLGELRFLDPACGCGNFLIVTYREMRALELEIMVRIQELDKRRQQTSLVLEEDNLVKVRMTSFYGIELEEWPATIARTAMFLVQHQANQDLALKVGVSPDMLPLTESATIVAGNALKMDWNEVLPASDNAVIMGNPPFLGARIMSADQKRDIEALFPRGDAGIVDYVTGWYAKASRYFTGPHGRWAFVSTNSIAQGQQVTALFAPIYASGWRIRFAHRTFIWTSEAPGAAAVHCTIIGFDRGEKSPPRLFTYDGKNPVPVERPAKSINDYLVDAPNVLINSRRDMLANLPPAAFGSMANDGGHLMVSLAEFEEVSRDPVAARYLRKFVGARELIRGDDRWCLWMENLDPDDVQRSAILRDRIEATGEHRQESKRATTKALAATPYLFGERRQPAEEYLCIPRHVSEARHYYTAQRFGPEVISGDANFVAADPEGYAFSIISSSMFITWQRTVGGRIKSDLRFSSTLVWNTLPLPQVDEGVRQQIVVAGQDVLTARAMHPDRTLAEHYNPLAMDPALLKAHGQLDKVVDKAFGCRVPDPSEEERQETLFKRYDELTKASQLELGKKPPRKRQIKRVAFPENDH